MSERTHYSRAPITEALIDIRVIAKEGIEAHDFDRLHESIKNRYPKHGKLRSAKLRLEITEETAATRSEAPQNIGRIFQGDKYIFQARTDGMTLTRMPPYEDWKSLLDEFKQLWQHYESISGPKQITRIAVRYINRFDLPLPFGDFKEFILTCPEVAPKLPQLLSGFSMQLQIPQPDIEAMLLLNEGLVPPPREGVASVVLDIDLFRDASQPIPVDFWPILESLHMRKNEVFEACITDKTRELIK